MNGFSAKLLLILKEIPAKLLLLTRWPVEIKLLFPDRSDKFQLFGFFGQLTNLNAPRFPDILSFSIGEFLKSQF